MTSSTSFSLSEMMIISPAGGFAAAFFFLPELGPWTFEMELFEAARVTGMAGGTVCGSRCDGAAVGRVRELRVDDDG